MLNAFRRHASVHVLIHLDHATPKDEDRIRQALAGGVDSVMVDGSELSLKENIAWTAKMVRMAHSVGVSVEGELGRLTGEEDGSVIDARESKMTDPVEAMSFVANTAVSVCSHYRTPT
jgi:fructose-bisphosphate aldolase class II